MLIITWTSGAISNVPWPISVTQLICKISYLLSAHIVLLASCIILVQLMCLIWRQSHLILTHTILLTTYILSFSRYTIFFPAPTSSCFHPIHHHIYNSCHLIYDWYCNLFANIFPPYFHLYHAVLVICPIFSPSKPIAVFLEVCFYKMVIATTNSKWHFDNKLKKSKGVVRSKPRWPQLLILLPEITDDWLLTTTPTYM